jgi:hypothetical protein
MLSATRKTEVSTDLLKLFSRFKPLVKIVSVFYVTPHLIISDLQSAAFINNLGQIHAHMNED